MRKIPWGGIQTLLMICKQRGAPIKVKQPEQKHFSSSSCFLHQQNNNSETTIFCNNNYYNNE